MGFNCGIIGLPNVGKSTLFNALTCTMNAEAANYPFCTIEPNKGIVFVPDKRLNSLSSITNSEKIIPTQIEFVDIAGLVRGASKGEGLGNQFLSHIREVDAIIHVLRCFEDSDVTHVEGKIDPLSDMEIVETELILADLESLEKRIPQNEKKAKIGDKLAKIHLDLMKDVVKLLEQGKPARDLEKKHEYIEYLPHLSLITSKPTMYVCNVLENEAKDGNSYSKQVEEFCQKNNYKCSVISSKIEQEIASLSSDEDKLEFLSELGLNETGLSKIIRSGFSLLGLYTYFTSGPKETRAWTIKQGAKAPEAAGVIHSDFEKGFIRAEVIAYDDYVSLGGESLAKEKGKMRLEGKEYIVQDGDVIHFRFNV